MQIAPREIYVWKLCTRSLELGQRTRVMGVLNVTPDSFSDGGRYISPAHALDHALQMLDDGADILDVGGESTRPGAGAGTADAIPAEEEQSRVLPLIREIRQARPDAIVSVDTYRASTARLAVEAGAEIVNDVSGMLWDESMAATCAELQCGVVAMHTRGFPSQWSALPPMDAVVPEVHRGLQEVAWRLLRAGCERSRIVLDPGFGFGKAGEENWKLLRGMDELRTLEFPLLAGLSRKRFLRMALEGIAHTESLLDQVTVAAGLVAALAGAHVVRVHDVRSARVAAGVADILRGL